MVDIQQEDILSVRDHAILELFYSSGLRLSELVNLNIGALDFSEGTVEVTGKGNKTRIVPMGSHAVSAIKKWLEYRTQIVIKHHSKSDISNDTSASRLFIGSQQQ